MDSISNIQAVATGLNLDHIPLNDEVIREFGSDLWSVVGAPTDTPDINVGITNGAQTAWFMTTGNIRGWTGPRKLYINPTFYLRIFNASPGGIQNLSYDGEQAKFIRGTSGVISGVVNVGAGATILIRPPLGEAWQINDFGSGQWLGVPPVGLPDIVVQMGDGVNWTVVLDGANSRLWFTEDMGININNAIYLQVTNTNALATDIGWSGIKFKQNDTASSSVKSNVAVVGIGGALNIAPVSTREEWMVTGVYSNVLFGGAPNMLPDINVNNSNGVLASLKARNTDVAFWLHHPNILVSSTNFLTLTDTSGAGAVLGYSAYRTRM